MTLRAAALYAVALLCTEAPALAALPAHVDLRAQTVGLFAGASPFVRAAGNAVVHVGARTVRADDVRYDLNANRLVASGHVTVVVGAVTQHPAAYALDAASGDAVFLDLDGPDPKTVVVPGDGSGAVVAAPAGGTFDVADITGLKPYVRGPHAVLVPNASVRFAPAHVLTDLGRFVPAPSYLYSFATNPSLAQQALPALAFDQPYALFATPNSLSSLHLLYQQGTGITAGVDTHLVDGTKSYLAASALPFVAGDTLDLIGFQQITPLLSQQVIASRESGLATAEYQLLHNEFASVTSLTLQQLGGLQTADLRISSLSRPIPGLFSYKLSADAGYDHESGLQPLASDTRTTLEGLFTTPSLRAPFGTTFSSSLDLSETVYNFPRERGVSVFSNFLSRRISRSLSLLGQVQFTQVFDRYRADQSYYYPPLTPVLPDGSTYYGYAAYQGAATTRTYSLAATYAPSADFNFLLSLAHDRDFPQFDGYGNPPYSLGFDLRVRPHGGPAIEFGRAYVFDWGGQRFSQTYTLSVAP